MNRHLSLLLLSFATLIGCAGDLTPTDNEDPSSPDGGTSTGTAVATEGNEDSGPWTITIDASGETVWAYFDLDTGTVIATGETEPNGEWDMAFQTTTIKTNSGIHGSGDVLVCPIENDVFVDITEEPTEGCFQDREDGDDADTKEDYAFHSPLPWYTYDPEGHVISTNPVVYVVTSTESTVFKVEVLNYYDTAGSPRFVTFKWALLEATADLEVPEPDATENTDAEEGEGSELPEGHVIVSKENAGTWTYLSLLDGPVVLEDGEGNWDLAVDGVQLQTKSGTSGEGFGGATLSPNDWDNTLSSETIGFQVDTLLPLPGPPGTGEFSGNPVLNGWFDYDMETHEVTSKEEVYLVRTSLGSYVKLQILSYAEGLHIRSAPIDRNVAVYTETLDITADEWTYIDFDQGALGEPGEEPMDGWDMAVFSTFVQTNSGTSGAGLGGVFETSSNAMEEVLTATQAGCYSGPPDHECDCEKDENQCTADQGMWTDQCNCDLDFSVDELLKDLTENPEEDLGQDVDQVLPCLTGEPVPPGEQRRVG